MTQLAVAITPSRLADVCDPATRDLIEQRFRPVWADEDLDADQLAELLTGAEAVLTSWGTPAIPEQFLGTDRARVVGHAAGTVKRLVPESALDDGVAVFSAAGRIAWSVGEWCLAACLSMWRRLGDYDRHQRTGGWKPDQFRGDELAGARIGIVGASSTARAFLTLLAPFTPDVVVYDPFLSPDAAAELGVRPVSLAEVMECPLVSVHVPNLPATEGMITAELLDRMPVGGLLINSSRAAAIDNEALFARIVAGRLRAALDVYDPEPAQLPEEILASHDVLLTPHIAGDSTHGHLALTGHVLRDMVRFLDTGEHGPSWVDPARWAVLA